MASIESLVGLCLDDFFCGSGSCDGMMKQDGQETGGGGAEIKTNGVWSFFRVVNLEMENFLIRFT